MNRSFVCFLWNSLKFLQDSWRTWSNHLYDGDCHCQSERSRMLVASMLLCSPSRPNLPFARSISFSEAQCLGLWKKKTLWGLEKSISFYVWDPVYVVVPSYSLFLLFVLQVMLNILFLVNWLSLAIWPGPSMLPWSLCYWIDKFHMIVWKVLMPKM